MSIMGIILATVVVGGTGLVIGLFLGVAGEKFKVEVDEKELLVREELPGNNCGGCGFAGCDALAKAIADGSANPDACPVGGEDCAAKIAEIMGAVLGENKRMTAFVKCAGSCELAKNNFDYQGVEDCKMLEFIPSGGPKACDYGCTGFGNCVKACEFNAIHIVDGIANVDKERCKACGVCIAQCPKHLIELVPFDAVHLVACSSKAKGKDVKSVCEVGCIGCKICEKACEFEAVTVVDNISHIDYDKCTNCGNCAEKCPRKIIV